MADNRLLSLLTGNNMLHALGAGPLTADVAEMSVDAARRVIFSLVSPRTACETVGLLAALDRILAADLISPVDVPNHDNSAMDGFAFGSGTLGTAGYANLKMVGASLAGHPFSKPVSSGECVRIMTGAAMPAGCDSVVAQELVKHGEGRIHFALPVPAGQHRRARGEDLMHGQVALARGTLLRPAHLGLVASLGISELSVHRRLRVAYFSSGNELRPAGEALAMGDIYDSNGPSLFGMLSRLGMEPIALGVVGDDPAQLSAVLKKAIASADVVISSGGVSVGEADNTRTAMAALGAIHFWRVAIKPGRPMAFGELAYADRSALYFGLPGNPVAAMVTFYILVRDALIALSGANAQALVLPRLRARSDSALSKRVGRSEYPRALLYPADDGWRVRAGAAQGSGILRSMTESNCLIELTDTRGDVDADDWVDVIPFEGLI